MGVPIRESRVARVTVFRRGAQVERWCELAGAEPDGDGTYRVRVGPLPLLAEDDSVEVHASESAPLAQRVVLATTTQDPSLPPPEDEELEAARAEVFRLEARSVALREAIGALDGIPLVGRRATSDAAPATIPVEARRALLAMRREQMEGLHGELAELLAALRDATRARDALESRRLRASTARQTRAHELRKAVDVSFRESPRGVLRVRYRVAAARWCPAYTLRLDEGLRGGALEMRALVAQRTGEDWTGAELTLSSAKPHQHVDLPEPTSIRIGKRQAPPARAGWREPPQGAEALFADFDRGYRKEPSTPPPKPRPRPTSVRAEAKAEAAAAAAAAAAVPMAPPPPGAGPPGPVGAATGFGGAAPPPMLQSMGAPAPARPPMAGAAPPAPPRRRGSVAKKKAKGRPAADLAMPAPPEEEAEPGVTAADRLLAYGALRLGGPDEGKRGALRMASAAERYREVLEADGHAVSFDLQHFLRHAGGGVDAFPPRTQEPRAVDGFDHVFFASSPVDVPSDGAFRGVPVVTATLEASPHFVCVPREADDVFRFVETTNPLDAPLLPGPLDVYVGGKYLLGRAVEVRPAGATWALGLGVEQRVKVARNTRFEERSAGLMGRALELVHVIDIDLENHTESEASVRLRERVPVAREGDDDVEVSHESDVTWRTYEPESRSLRGGLETTVTLAPGAKRSIQLTYVVRISAKHELVGGNRRE